MARAFADDLMAVDRRNWIKLLGKGMAAACLAGWSAAAVRFGWPWPRRNAAERVVLGPAAALGRGAAEYLTERNVYVVHGPQGYYALSGRCTHLGCAVAQHAEGFSCPCHGAQFDPLGKPIAGPATRSLTWYRLTVDTNQRLVLHLDQTVAPGTWMRV